MAGNALDCNNQKHYTHRVSAKSVNVYWLPGIDLRTQSQDQFRSVTWLKVNCESRLLRLKQTENQNTLIRNKTEKVKTQRKRYTVSPNLLSIAAKTVTTKVHKINISQSTFQFYLMCDNAICFFFQIKGYPPLSSSMNNYFCCKKRQWPSYSSESTESTFLRSAGKRYVDY